MAGLDAFTDVLDYPMYVVTAADGDGDGDGGRRAGCLVGFASQCSIDPPRFMVWLSRANHTYTVARTATHLAVHALRDDQKRTAELFGSRTGDDTDKFEHLAWSRSPHAPAPVLDDAAAWFLGRIEGQADGGDHVGFLLAPVDGSRPGGPERPPLLLLSDVLDLTPGHPA
ncbi:flavin reductase family protein [Streptomyces yangpuensis]|uniref:Flavin reductase family protein n=1 Tax=Streptomyces yangpuensis TaxID=1648182 RepID=A0ABY5Q5M7_9ACTN|nr:flavin reductase family protein [Streptomyces yangpuensis]UUY50943.1 flavin reductase family protein [Streptomyces yangpuensis]